MKTKKKIVIGVILVLVIVIVLYIAGNIFGFGMMKPPCKYSKEETQYCVGFEKKHPYLKFDIYLSSAWDVKFLDIKHGSKNKSDSLYYINLNKKELADSIAKTFFKIPQKHYSDSLFIVFYSQHTDTIHSKYYETRDVEFHYKVSK